MCPKSQKKGKVLSTVLRMARRPSDLNAEKHALDSAMWGICGDLLRKHFSRVVKTDNSKLRTAWEVRRKMHAFP